MQTIKASLELPPINKIIRWRISTTLYAPTQNPSYKDFSAYTKSQFNGGIYHKYTPRTYLIIEPIDVTQKDTPYFDKCLYLDMQETFRFKEMLKEFRDGFKTPSLFYYQEGVLKLDKEVAKSFVKTISVYNKVIKVTYAVIRDPENVTDEYEGIAIFVNNYNYIITFTSFEVSYIVDTLEKISLPVIGMQLIQGVLREKGS